MGKYVDLSKTVTASYYDEEHEEWRFKQRTIEDLLDDLCDSYSTVDAVPVVRCKDCKNSQHWYKDRRRCFLWNEDGISVFDSGFCNYGERKDGEHNED